jgi:hypothetical protein
MSALERRALQCCISLGALVPVIGGLSGAVFGAALMGEALSPSADSHFRYLSGLLMAIGLGFLSAVPNIERKTTVVRQLSAIVFAGGMFRAANLVGATAPSWVMYAATIMEVIVTPLLCLWQARVAKSA